MQDIDYKTIDNAIPLEFRQQVWEYLMSQQWYGYTRSDSKIHPFVPSKHGIRFPENMPGARLRGTMMSRTLFAKDEPELESEHPIIYELWSKINHQLGNAYEIIGVGEGVGDIGISDQSTVPGLGPGWRVYTNGIGSEKIKHSHGIHRDTIDLNDDSTRTILYVANLEWLPSWMAEIVCYSEDPQGTTGDSQQTQQAFGGHTQRRGFNVGWPSAIIAAVPGRIISYDGRTMHTTKPTSIWAPNMRITIAFRARLKAK